MLLLLLLLLLRLSRRLITIPQQIGHAIKREGEHSRRNDGVATTRRLKMNMPNRAETRI
jgi:hypothetical protein